jgi:hypothetical protein
MKIILKPQKCPCTGWLTCRYGDSTPVGTPAFEADKAISCADRACALVNELAILPFGEQDNWLVLHGLLQQRVANLPRGGAWEQVGAAVQTAQSHALESAFSTMGCPQKEGRITTEQMVPPLCHGGLGLRHTSASGGHTAYLPAATKAQIALQHGLAAFHPFNALQRS